MTESLRAALIQFLNTRGAAPDPASMVEIWPSGGSDYVFDLAYKTPRAVQMSYYELGETGLQDLLQFLLEYREV